MPRRVALALLSLVLLPIAISVFGARVALAQNADAGAPLPSATTRPSLVPDATASTTQTSAVPTSTAIPAATMPTPQVKPKSTDDTKANAPRSTEDVPASPNEVFSEDWWGRTRPVLEIHGYFRTRAELLHNFTL